MSKHCCKNGWEVIYHGPVRGLTGRALILLDPPEMMQKIEKFAEVRGGPANTVTVKQLNLSFAK